MSATKTTWEDLSRLGWPKYDVYKKANEARDGTMSNEGDLYLNTDIETYTSDGKSAHHITIIYENEYSVPILQS